VCASVFAPASYQLQRLSDLFCCYTLSHQAFMAALTRLVLRVPYPEGLPARLFWFADATQTEKPYVLAVPCSLLKGGVVCKTYWLASPFPFEPRLLRLLRASAGASLSRASSGPLHR
jgi:hypothetical protein